MKKVWILFALFLMVPIANAKIISDDIMIGAIRFGDYGYVRGPDMDSYIYVYNNEDCYNMKDTSINFRILDTDVFDSATGLRIKSHEGYGKTFMTPIDGLQGEYLVRVTVASGGVRRVKHRYIFIE